MPTYKKRKRQAPWRRSIRARASAKRRRVSYGYASTSRRGSVIQARRQAPRITKIKNLEHTVRKIKQDQVNEQGHMIYRSFYSGSLQAFTFAADSVNAGIFGTGYIEAALNNLKYFDPSNPGTLIVASASSGTYSRNSLIESMTNKLTFRNNYTVPVDVRVYHCTCKDDTSVDVTTAWDNNVARGSNLANRDKLGQYPTDYEGLTDLWNLKVAYTGRMEPGAQQTVSHHEKSFEYSSSTVDSHNLDYQKEYKGQMFLIHIQGIPGHNNVNDAQVTNMKCGLDYVGQITMNVKYSAGISLKFIQVNDGRPSNFTGLGALGVCAQKSNPRVLEFSDTIANLPVDVKASVPVPTS